MLINLRGIFRKDWWPIYLVSVLLLVNLILIVYFSLPQKSFQDGRGISSVFDNQKFKIIFLDVGQGDAILIQSPSKKNILVDGGPDKGIIAKLDQYIPFYERKIDLMILTHPDPDHLNGLVEVLQRYRVERFFYNGVKDLDSTYERFLEILEEKKIKEEVVWLGKNYEFDKAKVEVFFPFENLLGKSFENDNDASLVLKMSIGQIKILLTGDATNKVEDKLIKDNMDLKADILKVAHHGSKNSTSLEFLEKVKPTYAIISVGKNKFGHPSLRVLKNLEKVGAKILRTDQLNDILFETDGEKINLLNYPR
jgi:competence protein ComEC